MERRLATSANILAIHTSIHLGYIIANYIYMGIICHSNIIMDVLLNHDLLGSEHHLLGGPALPPLPPPLPPGLRRARPHRLLPPHPPGHLPRGGGGD